MRWHRERLDFIYALSVCEHILDSISSNFFGLFCAFECLFHGVSNESISSRYDTFSISPSFSMTQAI